MKGALSDNGVMCPSVGLSVVNRAYVRLVQKLPNQQKTREVISIKFSQSTEDIFAITFEIVSKIAIHNFEKIQFF